MAELCRLKREQPSRLLEAEHLIGRGSQCSLRLVEEYVSTQHAVIRWKGEGWEVVDRGSRNGTFLDGHRVETGQAYPLSAGARLAFGNIHDEWILHDVAAPEVMVVDIENGEAVLAVDGLLGLPSAEDPRATVYRNRNGSWCLEPANGDVSVLSQRTVFTVAGRSYRFCCPEAVFSTASAGVESVAESAFAVFAVSRDEEFVELSIEFGSRCAELGSRGHNYMLLTLARARLADRGSGLPETSCGWTDKDRLADSLAMNPPQIDGEVFRVRRHLAQCGLNEAVSVIERRPRTRQLRFGLGNIRIVQT